MSELYKLNYLSDIQYVIKHNPRVLIEFGAPWCAPCTRFEPHLVKFAERNTDILTVKVNIDIDSEVQTEFDIMSVPQVILFEDNRYVRHIRGRTVMQLESELK